MCGLEDRMRGRRAGRAVASALVFVVVSVLLGLGATAGAAPPGMLGVLLLSRTATQQAVLTAPAPQTADDLGASVAVSGDTALVGAPGYDTVAGSDAGAVFVYVRAGGVWTWQATLIAADGEAYDEFGASVALSGDTALVGSPWGDADVDGSGVAYIFTRSGASWGQQQKLDLPGEANFRDKFGAAVALSGDTAVIGAPERGTPRGADAGAAYVFQRSGAFWVKQAQLTASDGAEDDFFGAAVAVSGDTVVAGAVRHATSAGAAAGAAYVYARAGISWPLQQKLAPSDPGAAAGFGSAVAASGETVLVGAQGHMEPVGGTCGGAYVFARSGTTWTQQAKLLAADRASSDWFGNSVALSGDLAVVGAFQHDTAPDDDAGAAYAFRRSGGSWTQQARLTASDGAAEDEYGASVAVSAATALAGAPYHTLGAAVQAGAAYAYLVEPAPAPKPAISRLSPASGRRGATVTIIGTAFGATQGTSSVTFGAKKCTRYVSWSDMRVTCKVPAKAAFGAQQVRVTTTAGKSGAKLFKVKR